MKRGRGINGRDDRSSGIEIRMAEAFAKINPTDSSSWLVYLQLNKKKAKAEGKKCHAKTIP
jgi:hypothetical protein